MRSRIFTHSVLHMALLGLLCAEVHAAPPAAPKKTDVTPPPPPAEAPPKTPATSERVSTETKAAGSSSVVKTEEGKEGVKTYQFGAVEVEGRLRSPQLIYFLRRVRAEFVAGELGHRSFLLELDSTKRSSTFR
jgi:hypothetical protein